MELGQVFYIAWRYRLERATCFYPSFETARDHLCGAVLFFKLTCDTNAGGVARTGTVEIDLALRRHELTQSLQLFAQPVGLDADGVLDALGGGVVVAVRAHIGNDADLIVRWRFQELVEFLGGHPLDVAEAVFVQRAAEQPKDIQQQCAEDGGRREVAEAHDPANDDAKKRREQKSGGAPGSGVKEDAAGVELEEAQQPHVQAAGERSGDRAE